ncbi:MAG: hypothetical protein MUF05_02210 [Candidatus Omnitrophica bacterium]|jgi:uncharacterized membrane protein|nr:hypothetical protein [Candidatus Omnitrophota bacterium]
MPQDEIQEAKILAMAGYLPFLCILPLILKKENKFAVFHGKQGLVLLILLVSGLIINIIPLLGWIVSRIVVFLYLLFVFWGCTQALLGKYTRIPVVAEIADKIIL